ncbi:ABC transporter substrate-binding protein [Alcaligenaceae bacterium]|nr:ABC transporter substrate-binding protein [Alcaligenaceae bacterium]
MQLGMLMRRITGQLAAFSLAVLGLSALTVPPSQAQPGAPWQESKPALAAKRAITLAPHITELIFAAGAGEHIVATVISSDYPPPALVIPRIGDGLNINVEKTLAMRPDLVVAWQPSAAAATLAPVLARLHTPLIYSAPRSLQDIPAEIMRFGKIFDTEKTAAATAKALSGQLHALERRYAHRVPISVFMEIGTAPLYTIGSDPLLNDALRICGGVNIYAAAPVAAPQISAESVLVAQPKVIITSATDPARLEEAQQRWSRLHLQAARQGHVYGIDPDQLFRPGPRMVAATVSLCQYLDLAR